MIRKILTSSLITLIAIGGFFVSVERQDMGNLEVNGIRTAIAADTTQQQQMLNNQWSAADEKAATSAATGNSSTKSIDNVNTMIDYLNMALGAITSVVSPAIILASWLMSPDWTSGDLFGLRTVMHDLWVTISNILYFVYAVLLIIIALATMFNQEKFGYKVMLPKLALGIIMVPFTWWFVQWTISLAAVVTASVVSIPTDTLSHVIDTNPNSWYNRPTIPKNVVIDTTTTQKSLEEAVTDCKEPGKCIDIKTFVKDAGGQWSPLVVYAYGVFKFDHIDSLSTGTDMVKAAIQLIHKGIIGALMFLVFGILVLALIFMLMMRAVKLWMYAIFSPLFTLHFVVGKDLLGEKMDDFSLKEFIGLAFVPAVVGITLSFGLVILTAIYNPLTSGGNTSSPSPKDHTIVLFGNPKNTIKSQTTKDANGADITQSIVTIGGITWTFNGSATNNGETSGMMFGALDSAGNSLGTIIADIIALIFIWAAFMAAKNVSKAVKAAVDPFEQMGKKIGDLGMSLPKYMPLPLPGGSVAGMGKSADTLTRIPEHMAQERFDKSETGKLLKSLAGDNSNTAKTAAATNAIEKRDMNELSNSIRGLTKEGYAGSIAPLVEQNKAKILTDLEHNHHDFMKSDAGKDLKSILGKDKLGSEDQLKVQAYLGNLNQRTKLSDGTTAAETKIAANNATGESGNAGTTNNTFNYENDGTGKYSLQVGHLHITTPTSREEIIKKIEANIPELMGVSEDALRDGLTKMQIEKTKVDEILKKVELKKKEEAEKKK